MEMKLNPYPNRPYPVGALSYPLPEAHQKHVNSFRHIAMLEYGEPEVMFDVPRIIGGGLIANLGHAKGGSAVLMAMGLRELGLEGHVYSVDVFKQKNSHDAAFHQALDTLDRFKVSDKITVCRGTTNEWVERLKFKEFDFVFIDADHSYSGVLNDFLNWTVLLKTGGLVGFHDTNQEFSHKVLQECLIGNPKWGERKELHINRIRIFEKLV
jgi:hypothetical protein